MLPSVSIIVPCYNGARYIPGLAHSLRPVLASDPQRVELIFIDDGSGDDSSGLMRTLLPEAVMVRQANRGLSAARNAGVALARGEFLQLLDVDDTVEVEKLARQVAAAGAAGADVVYSDWRLLTVDGGEVRTEVFAPAQAPSEMVEALLAGWYVPPVGYLFRRSAYQALGGCDETLKVWEDFDLFLRCAMAGLRHAYVPGVLSTYYRYLDVHSLARRDPVGGALSRERILLKTLAALDQANELTSARRKAAARALFAVLRTAGIGDGAWLRRIAARINALDPDFQPFGTTPYRALARAFGIVRAERLAIGLRAWSSAQT